MEDELDGLLKKRVVPAPSQDLAERIIARAAQEVRASVFDQIRIAFVFRRPVTLAYTIMLLGVVLGFNMQVPVTETNEDSGNYLYLDDEPFDTALWIYEDL